MELQLRLIIEKSIKRIFLLQFCLNGNENTTPDIAMRCLIGLPIVMAMFATVILDITSYQKIKSRNHKDHQSPNSNSNQPIIHNIISFHLLKNSPRRKCLETSIRSTTISSLLFIILFSIFIIGAILGMSPYYVVALTFVSINSVRVPSIASLALNKNQTNAFKSRTTRQEWELKNAEEERKKRLEAKKINT